MGWPRVRLGHCGLYISNIYQPKRTDSQGYKKGLPSGYDPHHSTTHHGQNCRRPSCPVLCYRSSTRPVRSFDEESVSCWSGRCCPLPTDAQSVQCQRQNHIQRGCTHDEQTENPVPLALRAESGDQETPFFYSGHATSR
ncbi:hypothetical protein PLEOSDRAFT_1088575 [Pleurotus ostreatus PC15]|uniref:Uncharacterized protein n=1 Tax=Pleurotus ostreatus (strain PC15) TaxID=1137138 RepID=A0A067P3B3_PLEO1|nr:hypothetical protein PLEOSDRAFT_1088575 [Pleurotus ostreatus PC15]